MEWASKRRDDGPGLALGLANTSTLERGLESELVSMSTFLALRVSACRICEEVHDGGGQGPGDREWNDDSDGTGQLDLSGTGELGLGGRLALLDAHVEALGGRRKVQGGGRTEVQVGKTVVQGGRSGARVGRI